MDDLELQELKLRLRKYLELENVSILTGQEQVFILVLLLFEKYLVT